MQNVHNGCFFCIWFFALGMAVYNVVIACVVGTPVVTFVQDNQFEASFIVTAICILFSTTSTLCIVFVPKVRVCESLSVCLSDFCLSVSQSVSPSVCQPVLLSFRLFIMKSVDRQGGSQSVIHSVNLRILNSLPSFKTS